jgi:6-pyruvoyltetrahydropterin/6-carboxytetrahydropterin synthase
VISTSPKIDTITQAVQSPELDGFDLDVTLVKVAESADLVKLTGDGSGSTYGACTTSVARPKVTCPADQSRRVPNSSRTTMNLSAVPLPTGDFTIGKKFGFEAGHRLPDLPAEHKCARQHGHSYEVEVIVTAPVLEEPGFVTDFGALAPFKKFLDIDLDHRNLHEILPFEPTSERLAQFLAGWFIQNVQPTISGRLVAVLVRETGSSWARFDVEGQ